MVVAVPIILQQKDKKRKKCPQSFAVKQKKELVPTPNPKNGKLNKISSAVGKVRRICNGRRTTSLYHKRDDFDFAIVNFPFACSKKLLSTPGSRPLLVNCKSPRVSTAQYVRTLALT
jgi:hypothetical protein